MSLDTFAIVLEDPKRLAKFRECAVSHYCQESLDFVIAVERFRKRFIEESRAIWDEYVRPDSDHLVNLTSEETENIKSQLENPRHDMFEEAKISVAVTLASNLLQEFEIQEKQQISEETEETEGTSSDQRSESKEDSEKHKLQQSAKHQKTRTQSLLNASSLFGGITSRLTASTSASGLIERNATGRNNLASPSPRSYERKKRKRPKSSTPTPRVLVSEDSESRDNGKIGSEYCHCNCNCGNNRSRKNSNENKYLYRGYEDRTGVTTTTSTTSTTAHANGAFYPGTSSSPSSLRTSVSASLLRDPNRKYRKDDGGTSLSTISASHSSPFIHSAGDSGESHDSNPTKWGGGGGGGDPQNGKKKQRKRRKREPGSPLSSSCTSPKRSQSQLLSNPSVDAEVGERAVSIPITVTGEFTMEDIQKLKTADEKAIDDELQKIHILYKHKVRQLTNKKQQVKEYWEAIEKPESAIASATTTSG